ncbi:conserved hypothetical protein [Frankia canadensis]|uniref:UPF0235 protein FRACA_1950015 n=1 Tax=Frankia canadensis TaxID=1836972 RepID=A0A2I2KPI7_9ACTN|nr:DUF167 domain-containing protein [Frankia canadensis]SNQ47562.1 conserved hypothetical protein [Frankia canadensis]SOU54852.1 conserved hypothetical protein [Frankia canadensis]
MRVTIRVQPGARGGGVGGLWDDPRDGAMLVVRVAARAVDGRATEAALRALADALGVRRADLCLVRGATSRAKTVEVTPTPAVPEDALRARLHDLLHA